MEIQSDVLEVSLVDACGSIRHGGGVFLSC